MAGRGAGRQTRTVCFLVQAFSRLLRPHRPRERVHLLEDSLGLAAFAFLLLFLRANRPKRDCLVDTILLSCLEIFYF